MKNRIISFCLACFLLCSIMPLPILALSDSLTIHVGAGECAPGKSVTIPIGLGSNSGLVSMSLSVTYDTSALTLISCDYTDVISGAVHSANYMSPYKMTWENDILTSNITRTGTIAYLTFLVSEDAKVQDYPIIVRIPTDGVLDANGNSVSVTAAQGTITVSEAHVCSFGEWEEYNSKKHVRYCDGCDEKEYANHTWNEGEIIKEPSHKEEGSIEYTCEDCGATKNTTIDVEPHSYGEWTKYNEEQHKRHCSCGYIEYEKHDWNDGVITKEPTTTTSGTMTYTCTVCDATRDEEIPALEHTHSYTVDQVVAPTCTDDGYTVYKCSDCGSTYQDNITEATGHNYSSVVVNPTCQEQGYTEHTCNKCGDSYKNNYVSAVEHKYENGKCTYCGAVNSDTPDTTPVTGITLSETSVVMTAGSHFGQWVYATISPPNATNQDVIWTTSDVNVADIAWPVDNTREGIIIAKAIGTAIITASTADGNYTAQCVVTVEPNTNAPTILIESDPLRAGQTAEVHIRLKNNPGIASLKFNLTYDTDILTLTDINYNSAIGGQAQQPQNYNSPVVLNWFNGSADSEGDFLFATLTFTVNAEAVAGETTKISLTYDENDIYDISETNIDFYAPEFIAEIVDYVSGDINGDNVVNNKDLTRMFQYLSDWDVAVNKAALDVNGDGAVNNKDLTRLFQYLSGWDVEIY